ncbi:MAG: UDP-N-acetylmuramoyl-L-alanine--D-glutamate ligase [Gammaproteobacteria bacterium]|jgi:UDP-N-acetylmuramoylalanine--D-glutamate ligase
MINLNQFRGQTMAVMGLGKSGLATARALRKAGVRVLAWDDSEARRETVAREGIKVADLADVSWADIDALVLSPGIPHRFPAPHPVAEMALDAGCPIISDIQLLAHAAPDACFIGITGTNGKSTTTSLIGHLLAKTGRHAAIGGNLGRPVLDLDKMSEGEFYVIEMSSFQLEITAPVPFDIAVLLNVTPDHLERHGGMDGYVAAKKRVFDGQRKDHAAIVGIDDGICRSIFEALGAAKHQRVLPISGERRVAGGVYAVDRVLYDDTEGRNTPILGLDEIHTLPGTHNAQNASAAYATARIAGLTPAEIRDAMRSFPGLAHRQELAAEIDGVLYVNDSKATNADAAARALSSYTNIYWIAGGQQKEDGLAAALPYVDHVRHAFLIGQAADPFAAALEGKTEVTVAHTLADAVPAAHEKAQRDKRPGTVVLLSPACASYDQFSNFEERGLEFCRLVSNLPGANRNIRNFGDAA